MYIFISHSSKDAKSAEKVCALLEGAGHSCFIAPRDIRSGHEYAEELMLGIERSDALVLMLSEDANTSPHVLREVEHAASRSIPILVYKMEEVALTKSMEYFLMTHQWLNQKADTDFDVILKSVEDMEERLESRSASGNDAQIPLSDSKNAKHSSKTKKAVWFVAAALLVAVAAAGIVFFGKNGQQTSVEERQLVLGDTVALGSYNGEPISWNVIHLSEDGSKAVLITEDIITMKAYDAAESKAFNIDGENDYWKYRSEDFEDKALEAKVRGSNDWSRSSIRTWLNSDQQVVTYEDGAPVKTVMSDKKNAYDSEPGFLYGFRDEERAVLVETQIESTGLAETNGTKDKVFLLNLEELAWLEESGVSVLTKPTEAAVNQDATKWYRAYSLDYDIENYFWWLREPKEGSASQCYMVTNGLTSDMKTTQIVGTEGFGIRPALAVDIRKFMTLMSE